MELGASGRKNCGAPWGIFFLNPKPFLASDFQLLDPSLKPYNPKNSKIRLRADGAADTASAAGGAFGCGKPYRSP